MDLAWTALLLPLKVAGFATLINLVLGVALAYLFARKRFWGREVLDSFLSLPMVMPPTVLGYYLLVLLGKKSALGQFLYNQFGIQLIFTWQAATIAAAIVALPLVYKPARSAFESIDPQLEQAARTLGLSNAAIFFRVSFPLAWRGILGGLLLGFARALGEFGATLMVAGSVQGKTQTLSIAIYEAVQAGDDALANTMVAMASIVCVVILLVSNKIAPHYRTSTGVAR